MSSVAGAQLLHEALAHHQQGRFTDAEALYRRLLAADPRNVDALRLLGLIAYRFGHFAPAADLLRSALAGAPDAAEIHTDLGNALGKLKKPAEAVAAYQQAVSLNPSLAEAWNNLGSALIALGQPYEAAVCLRRAVALQPQSAQALGNLAHALFKLDRLDEALDACDRALAIEPNDFGAHMNRGNILKEQGRLADAMAAYSRASALQPDIPELHGSVLYAMHFDPSVEPETLLAEHRAWAERFADPLTRQAAVHANDRDRERRLKVGLVSPDLRNHAVGRFLLPLLEHHDLSAFELVCYSTSAVADPLTARLRRHAGAWHDVAALSDEALAAQIREDCIDILLELSLHMAGSRLLMFARKPAPVQATYLGYAGTSGMAAMDFRITDPYLDPPGGNDALFSERSAYVESYWCYSPPEEATEIAPPPRAGNGYVTFGCLNNFAKVSPAAIAAWRDLLQRLPEARFILNAPQGSHPLAREALGAGERVSFVTYQSMRNYLATYQRIDIALDTFPYAGGTTTCDALWMGVPVISLAGRSAVGRGGVSILSSIGLEEMIANDQEQYLQLALDLARDERRMAELRSSMRERMQSSKLMNGTAFARSFESALRTMWKNPG